jgi:hypothetical protein
MTAEEQKAELRKWLNDMANSTDLMTEQARLEFTRKHTEMSLKRKAEKEQLQKAEENKKATE